jgi:predicted phosphodiesterase
VKILVVSDIHGNYHALDCVMKNVGYDVLLCCGDLVVDYPSLEQCINLLKDNCAHICSGNNDYIVSYDQKPSELSKLFNLLFGEWLPTGPTCRYLAHDLDAIYLP